jgi:hypothetical protein
MNQILGRLRVVLGEITVSPPNAALFMVAAATEIDLPRATSDAAFRAGSPHHGDHELTLMSRSFDDLAQRLVTIDQVA